MSQPKEIVIELLAGLGDGVGYTNGHPVFVPYTVTGDKVQIEITQPGKDSSRARLLEIVEPSLQRQNPTCPHFGVCGGCNLQHVGEPEYYVFKKGILTQIVRRLGYDESVVQNPVAIGPHTRRRVELKIAVNKGVVSVGYFAARSHQLVDIRVCPISEPAIEALIEPVRQLVASLKKPGNVLAFHVTLADSGLDGLFTIRTPLTANDKDKIVQWAMATGFKRVSAKIDGSDIITTLVNQGKVEAHFGGISIELPAPAFLQATSKGQEAITGFILHHTQGHDRVVDLYSGCGTYSIPLARSGHHVSAFEGSYDMVMALNNAIRRHGLEASLRADIRDLFAKPLSVTELNAFDAVVINPPHNGAETQAKAIAACKVTKVVMVSCNPATFERDAKHLIAGGYQLVTALPIDQFYWSAHLELAACFVR